MVMPGRYSVSLIVNGQERAKKSITLLPDPARPIAEADRKERQALREELQRLERDMIDARNTALFINDTLTAIRKKIQESGPSSGSSAPLDSLTREFDAVRHTFGIWNQGEDRFGGEREEEIISAIVELAKNMDGILMPPTAPMQSEVVRLRERSRTLGAAVDAVSRRLDQYRGRSVPTSR
jgi:hypothetical protein